MSSKEKVGRGQGDFLQTLERGLAVIRSFDRSNAQMTLSDVSRRTGVTKAASRRILHTLVTLGYARTDGKVFELTPRVLELGYGFLSSFGLADIALPSMEGVSRESGESCSMAVLDRAEIVYVVRVPARRVMEQSLNVGTRLPAYPTALGQVLLAALPDSELSDLIDAYPLPVLTKKTITDRDEYMRKIATVRRLGYALVDEELELGVRAVAVPVHDRRNRVIAAVNVEAHAGRVTLDDMTRTILPIVRRAVHEIERPIGAL